MKPSVKKDRYKDLLDQLQECVKDKYVEDRLGGYMITFLDRGQARKAIKEWETKNKNRVSA